MSERRYPWYLLIALALLLAPFAIAIRPAQAQAGVYTVDKLTDDPSVVGQSYCDENIALDCSLRQAIDLAESDGIPSSISFAGGLTGVITLNTASNGPLTLTEGNTKIEALTNPPAITQPPIEIAGNGSSDPAFTINSSGNTIKGLSITGFTGLLQPQGAGVLISGLNASGNTISGNYIGVKPDGTTLGSNVYGIRISSSGALGNTISGNIIVGSQISGVLIDNSSGNTLVSNLIGIGLSNTALPNAEAGIEIASAGINTSTNNVIGGLSSQANFISGNGPGGSTVKAGILLRGPGTTSNTISANLIGTDITGTVDVGNRGDGIRIASGASNNTIGGTNAAPVVLSGNSGYGIRITGTNTSNNQLTGGIFVGLNRNRNAALANDLGGIAIDQGAVGTSISGGPTALTLIGGNAGPGVGVSGSSTARSRIENAFIGAAPNPSAVGTITVANAGGVLVQGGAQQTTLNANTISGNTGYGIRLSATKTVTITGNLIGFDVARTGTLANTGPGIDVQDASSNTLIGGSPANANYLAGNESAAISIAGTQTVSSTVSSNIIGLVKEASADTLYLKAAGNGGDGVLITGGPKLTAVTANTIGSNNGAGVKIVGSATTTATVSLNNIGWTVTSALDRTPVARANATGITLDAAQAVDVLTNTLRLNTGDALFATDVLTVTVRANVMLGQTGNGVRVAGASRNVQVLANTISLNAGQATLVQGTSQRVRIQTNRMTGNAGGVLLQGTSIYGGSGADADTATLPNHGIDPPIFDPANTNPLRLRLDQNGIVSGWVYTDTNRVSSCVPVASCRIQFFRSGEGVADNQGLIPLKLTTEGGFTSDFATPDASGFFSGQLLDILPLPDQLLFAATDGNGNSSAFGVLTVAPNLSLSHLSPISGQQNALPNQTVIYTLSLRNSGNIDFTNLNFTTGNTLAHWVVGPLNGSVNLLSLPANSTKTITVSLTLPVGTDANARAGIQDTTLVTATVSDLITDLLARSLPITTTVTAAPVVVATTIAGSGSAPPGGEVTHTHRFTNTGNVTVTLDLTRRTVDPADSGFIWATTLSRSQITLGPGASADVDVTVTVPAGAQVLDALGSPIRVTTYVTATAQAPYGSIVRVLSGTTGVDLVPSVQLSGNGQSDSAASNAEISFFHSVVNTSNGPAHFCLNYRSNSGSRVVSFIAQNGVAITTGVKGSCFTLDTLNDALSGKSTILRFKAVISVTGILLPGQVDSISMYLTRFDTGAELANGSVTDSVTITSSPLLPRLWIPLVVR